MSNVINRPFHLTQIAGLAEDILKLIYDKSNTISVAEAIGTLEIVKQSIIEDQLNAK